MSRSSQAAAALPSPWPSLSSSVQPKQNGRDTYTATSPQPAALTLSSPSPPPSSRRTSPSPPSSLPSRSYIIRGVAIAFPYPAYASQQLYMEKVIEACQSSRHALLESPTGTGKTAALLCSVLSWTARQMQRIEVQVRGEGGSASLSSLSAHQRIMADITANCPPPLISTRNSSPPAPVIPPLPRAPPIPSLPLLSSHAAATSPLLTTSSGFPRPRVIYSSRTHSQLSKVITELKRTIHRPKMTLLGSRQQLCVHPDVRGLSGIAQNHACHALVNGHQCVYYENLAGVTAGRKGGGLGLQMESCMDLEDLLQFGEDHQLCPYFSTREVLSEAELVLMPYNYLIDGAIRSKLQLNMQGSVVIFDEAHNLESVCMEASSFDLTALDLAAAITEVERCIAEATAAKDQLRQQEADDPWSSRHPLPTSSIPAIEELLILKQLLLLIEKNLLCHEMKDVEKGETKDGLYMFELLEQCKITFDKKDALLSLIDSTVEFLLKCDEGITSRKRTSAALAKLAQVFRIVYAGGAEKCREVARDYRVHIHEKVGKKKGWAGKKAAPTPGRGIFHAANKTASAKPTLDDDEESSSYRVLSYWCMNPGVSMAALSQCGVRSFLLTSGTLSPLDSFAAEFQLSFPVRLENAHIIQPHQILLSVIERGPSGQSLLSAYSNRGNAGYTMDLGNAIVNFCRIVPDGVLVFFPSYWALESCKEEWEKSGIMSRIKSQKYVVYEPRQSSDFSAAIAEYQQAIERKQGGAIFFAVCRGKVSEGLDFADANGRAVVITGLPFPALHEAKVRIKREFLDQQRTIASQTSSTPLLTGNVWYQQQASRAVNQAIGRVIRHVNDYGAILLCDERFASPYQQQQLSAWVRGRVMVHKQFASVIQPLRGFFKRLEGEMGSERKEKVEREDELKSTVPMGEAVEGRVQRVGSEVSRKRRMADKALEGLMGDEDGMAAGRTDPASPPGPVPFKRAALPSTRPLSMRPSSTSSAALFAGTSLAAQSVQTR